MDSHDNATSQAEADLLSDEDRACIEARFGEMAKGVASGRREVIRALRSITHLLTVHEDALEDSDIDGLNQMVGRLEAVLGMYDSITHHVSPPQVIPLDLGTLMAGMGEIKHDG